MNASDGLGQVSAAKAEELSHATLRWKKVAPYLVTLLIFGLILWRPKPGPALCVSALFVGLLGD